MSTSGLEVEDSSGLCVHLTQTKVFEILSLCQHHSHGIEVEVPRT